MAKKLISRKAWAPIRTTLHGSAAILSMVGMVSVINVGYYLYKGDRTQLRADLTEIINSPERGVVASTAKFLDNRLLPAELEALPGKSTASIDPIPVGLGGD